MGMSLVGPGEKDIVYIMVESYRNTQCVCVFVCVCVLPDYPQLFEDASSQHTLWTYHVTQDHIPHQLGCRGHSKLHPLDGSFFLQAVAPNNRFQQRFIGGVAPPNLNKIHTYTQLRHKHTNVVSNGTATD